jgi:YfiH family protein
MMNCQNGTFYSTLLTQFKDIGHGFSSRSLGDMRDAGVREKFASLLSVISPLVMGQQVHGNGVAHVDKTGEKIPNVDGLVSCNASLGVVTADCIPLLLVDPVARVYGAAHSGWKGTLGGIATVMVKEMIASGAQVSDIRGLIGPHICMNCYTVPKDRADAFPKEVTKEIDGVWHLDIGACTLRKLLDAGLLPDHIDSDFPCTSCQNDMLFSYRKDSKERYGEIIGVIGSRI